MVNDLPPKERDIAMVFQNYALYPHMTVSQNMAFSLKLRALRRSEIEASVKRAAAILGLDDLLARSPRQLSGGQRQRVAMGRAIVRDPKVFLFDEPLSNLDAKLRVQMRAEIKELHQRLGTTTIYVTHDQIEAMTMADRIVVMRDGVVEQIGKPLELYDRPANQFVAAFIGSPSMNMIEGRIATTAGKTAFVTSGGIELPMPVPPRAGTEGPAVYGVRPEHLAVAPSGFPVTVSVIEPTGSETHLLARLGEDSLTITLRDRVDAAPGDTIHLMPDLAKLHMFDASSGARLW